MGRISIKAANKMTRPKNCLTEKKDEWLRYYMCVLLPLEYFKPLVKLQTLEKNDNIIIKTHLTISSVIKQVELHKLNESIILEAVMQAN